jgi:hypothetical protein
VATPDPATATPEVVVERGHAIPKGDSMGTLVGTSDSNSSSSTIDSISKKYPPQLQDSSKQQNQPANFTQASSTATYPKRKQARYRSTDNSYGPSPSKRHQATRVAPYQAQRGHQNQSHVVDSAKAQQRAGSTQSKPLPTNTVTSKSTESSGPASHPEELEPGEVVPSPDVHVKPITGMAKLQNSQLHPRIPGNLESLNAKLAFPAANLPNNPENGLEILCSNAKAQFHPNFPSLSLQSLFNSIAAPLAEVQGSSNDLNSPAALSPPKVTSSNEMAIALATHQNISSSPRGNHIPSEMNSSSPATPSTLDSQAVANLVSQILQPVVMAQHELNKSMMGSYYHGYAPSPSGPLGHSFLGHFSQNSPQQSSTTVESAVRQMLDLVKGQTDVLSSKLESIGTSVNEQIMQNQTQMNPSTLTLAVAHMLQPVLQPLVTSIQTISEHMGQIVSQVEAIQVDNSKLRGELAPLQSQQQLQKEASVAAIPPPIDVPALLRNIRLEVQTASAKLLADMSRMNSPNGGTAQAWAIRVSSDIVERADQRIRLLLNEQIPSKVDHHIKSTLSSSVAGIVDRSFINALDQRVGARIEELFQSCLEKRPSIALSDVELNERVNALINQKIAKLFEGTVVPRLDQIESSIQSSVQSSIQGALLPLTEKLMSTASATPGSPLQSQVSLPLTADSSTEVRHFTDSLTIPIMETPASSEMNVAVLINTNKEEDLEGIKVENGEVAEGMNSKDMCFVDKESHNAKESYPSSPEEGCLTSDDEVEPTLNGSTSASDGEQEERQTDHDMTPMNEDGEILESSHEHDESTSNVPSQSGMEYSDSEASMDLESPGSDARTVFLLQPHLSVPSSISVSGKIKSNSSGDTGAHGEQTECAARAAADSVPALPVTHLQLSHNRDGHASSEDDVRFAERTVMLLPNGSLF